MKYISALVALIGIAVAAPAFADDAQPGGPLPSLGTCVKVKGKDVCVQPAAAIVPVVVDFRSGNVEKNVAVGAGYSIRLPKALYGREIGIDFLAGVQTEGNWIAAAMPRLDVFRLGVVVSHHNGRNYAGAGFGVGY